MEGSQQCEYKEHTEVGKHSYSDSIFDLGIFSEYGQLKRLKVYYSDDWILGLELFYGNTSTGVFKGLYELAGAKEGEIEVSENDYLKSVKGSYDPCSNYITSLIIQTSGDKVLEVGKMSNDRFVFYKANCPIASFKLAFGKCLSYLQPIYSEEIYEINSDDLKITNLYGTWYEESQKFDNEYQFEYGNLKEVKVYSDDYVKGYALTFENKTIQVCNIFPNSENKVKERSLKLSPNEFVSKIYIRAGAVVDHLSFITSAGSIVSGGSYGGSGKLYEIPNDFTFVGFIGGLQSNLHYLKLKLIKI
jgi:hypothetical protein